VEAFSLGLNESRTKGETLCLPLLLYFYSNRLFSVNAHTHTDASNPTTSDFYEQDDSV